MPKQTFLNLAEEKRQRIIEVALEEFASHPYSKASLSNIVARAGIAKGSMYQYFHDKKDLYIYLLDLAAKEKLAYIQKGVDPYANFFTLLEQIILAGIRFNLENPRLGQVVANAMEYKGEEVLQEFFERGKEMSLQFFEGMLQQARDRGTIRKDLDSRLLAYVLLGILGSGLSEYLLDTMGISRREFLTNTALGEKFSEEDLGRVTSKVIHLLRNGMEAKE
ncbi:MAG: TetR/AcrR family transcriptional regulator [Clostridia bacterium]|nr:TetR/AcrR family transcriptional regulator [Clostridia bacterium]